MIIGIGIDLVEIERIAATYARFGQRFLAHILHPNEFARLPRNVPSYLASRFAAKEATVKALGTGFAAGIVPTQIETDSTPAGRPLLLLHDSALARADKLGVRRFHLSISHEHNAALAMVILEA